MNTKYEKPVVALNNCCSEGVYAVSGRTKPHPLCGSDYITAYEYGPGSGDTYLEFYHCAGCPNSRNNTECALLNGEYDNVVNSNNGDASKVEGYLNQKPRWESENYPYDGPVDVTWLW